jgi:hypothetical protein
MQKIWLETWREGFNLLELDTNVKNNLKFTVMKENWGGVWSRLIWLRTETSGVRL